VTDTILLLHGLGLHPWAMSLLARRCRRAGYVTRSLAFASRRDDAQAAASAIAEDIVRAVRSLPSGGHLHVIAHSMGCLVTLFALQTLMRRDSAVLSRFGRVVLLAPPFGGSRLADLASKIRPVRAFLGPALTSLRHGQTGLDRSAAVPVCFGIVAGSRSLVPGLDLIFGSGHDGRVAIEATRHDGAADHIVLRVDHNQMLWSRNVVDMALAFLAEGHFPRHV
jgi:pimeloyl-ACP methyl ester carboxylesterase